MAIGSADDPAAPGAGRNYLKLFMALCCLSAVGIAGTTYESTLESDPDEIIDVKHEWLPIGKDKIQEFKNPERAASAGGGGGGGSSEEPAPCTGGFVGFLASLFPSLIPPCGPFYLLGLFLPVLLLLAALGLGYRYRRRLIAPAIVLRAWFGEVLESDADDEARTWPAERPTNEVQHAWLAMVERANVDRPRVRSPGECARAAVDDGMESEAVATLTRLFEDVRYGNAPLTEERRARATECHRNIANGSGEPLADGSGRRRPAGAGGRLGGGLTGRLAGGLIGRLTAVLPGRLTGRGGGSS